MQNYVDDLLFKEESYKIVGICMKIHGKLGKGFREIVYKDAIEFELKKNAIVYQREKPLTVSYENTILPHQFRADFLIYESIILEIKVTNEFKPENFIQTLNYLKSAQVKLGILINFGEDRLKFQRIICSYQSK